MNRAENVEPATTYEGRPLARPGEDLEDQGLSFDVTTLVSRRRMLTLVGMGAASVAVAACGASGSRTSSPGVRASTSTTTNSSTTGSSTTQAPSGSSLTEIPDETAGPYPGDGSNGPDVLEQSGIIRSDIRSSFGDASGVAEGVPLDFELTILDMANDNAPFEGVAVYAWHCTRDGRYSMYSDGVTDENFLRGVQVTDAKGKVRFTSIFPACYSGRWPHIHFEVYPDTSSISDSTKAIATSQIAMPEDVCKVVFAESGYEDSVRNLAQVSLASDNVFGDDSGVSQLATVTGSVSGGYTASLVAPVDTTTEPTGGGAPPAGGPGGQGGPPPGGGPGGGPGGDGGPPPTR